MDLLHGFNDFIAKETLFSPGDRLLLAVSGGLDSVVLCELCHRAGYHVVVAHCNFGLRGEESQRDERFVRQLAAGYGWDVLVSCFDTTAYAAEHRLSVQVAARQLRYEWFLGLIADGTAQYVVTAHHLDDNIETVLMNFFKGAGIAGLRGMLPKQDKIVRPLLFAARERLVQFAREAGVSWVEDSSNQSDKYTRNYFRHQVIPLIGQVYPGALSNLAANLGRFRDIELIYRRGIEQERRRLVEYRGSEVHIPVLKLRQAQPLMTILYELTAPYGFSPQQTGAVQALLDSASGKFVLSATHRCLKDRGWLIITPLETAEAANILVEAGATEVVYAQGALRFRESGVAAPAGAGEGNHVAWPDVDEGPTVAWLDASRLSFPLLLRKWRNGDYFYPLGMRKKKKLARFFIDHKLSLAEKEKVWVLEADKKIVWVVGWRIDDRCRLGPGTKRALRIEWIRSPGVAG
jgi:tRNA(Ile)-lysidine synthase